MRPQEKTENKARKGRGKSIPSEMDGSTEETHPELVNSAI